MAFLSAVVLAEYGMGHAWRADLLLDARRAGKMNAEVLGKSISQATKFLQKVHEDLRSQIGSLDRLMNDHGWDPAEENKIGFYLGNSLRDGKLWVAETLQRCYIPHG